MPKLLHTETEGVFPETSRQHNLASRVETTYHGVEGPLLFFIRMMRIFQRMRELSIDGAEKIGEGVTAEVYRIGEEEIVKVYRPNITMEAIEREKALSRWALVQGLPTAISFDVVRVGDRYGIVYEMLGVSSASDYIRGSEEHLDLFIRKSVDLMKQIHSIEVRPGELPDMKMQHLEWLTDCSEYLSSDIISRLRELLMKVPDRHTLLHADFHLRNIMISNGELMLIDMDTLCMGDPVFELATIYNSYREFPSISPEAAAFLGIDVPTAYHIWDRTSELYLEGEKDETVQKTADLAGILGCIRIIRFMNERRDRPESELCIRACTADIKKMLPQTERHCSLS